MDIGLRSELAVLGLRAAPAAAAALRRGPERRRALGARRRARRPCRCSPTRRGRSAATGRCMREGVIVDAAPARRRDGRASTTSTTADGVPYEQIARLHGRHVLATTVVQTCVRYEREQPLPVLHDRGVAALGRRRRTSSAPSEIAEVALAAVRLDGVRQLVMTTGTSNGPDRGARHLARCVAAVKDVLPNLPIQVQIEPPDDLVWITRLHAAGATAIGIHVDSLYEETVKQWTPGKARRSLEALRGGVDRGRHRLRPHR